MNDDNDTQARVERWVRPGIRAMRAYQVHGAEGLIKLDAMENPYPFPRWLLEKWLASLRHVSLNRYPDASAMALKECLADLYEVPDGYPLVLGNGSDELIQMLALAMGGGGPDDTRPRADLCDVPGDRGYCRYGLCRGAAER